MGEVREVVVEGEQVTHLGKPPLGKDSLLEGHCRLAGERARGNSI